MKRLLLLLAVTACVSTACNSVTPYAAIVNGQVISTSLVDEELHAISSNPSYVQALEQQQQGVSQSGGFRPGGPNTINSNYVGSVVYERVVAILIHDELLRRHLKVPDDAYKKKIEDGLRGTGTQASLYDSLAANYRDQIVRFQADVQTIQDSLTTPEAISKYYTDNQATMAKTCILQLNVPVASADGLDAAQAKALDLRARLAAGGDYVTLAKETAAPGDPAPTATPDCFNDYEIPATSLQLIDPLKVGEVSQPLQSQSGLVLVQIASRTPLSLDDATAYIKTKVGDVSAVVDDLISKAKIKVNPRYGEFQVPSASATGSVSPHVPVLLDPNGTQPTSSADSGLTNLQSSTGSASAG